MDGHDGHVIPFIWKDGSEHVIIELQGFLESSSSLDGLDLGCIRFSGKDASLVIGAHELVGKQVNLSKPLVVTRKVPQASELHVVGVVRKKYVFKTRPNTITTRPK